jgi:phage replication O-like protein O
MANPQVEDGYLRIATKLWWALCEVRVPGEARQILDVIIGKTYGFNKKADWIANSQFCELTGIGKTHVERALKKLIDMNLVTQKGNKVPQKGNCERVTYSFNKDYETWKKLPKKGTVPHNGKRVTNKGKTVTHNGAYNIQSTKDNLQKTTSSDLKKSDKTEFKEFVEWWMREYHNRFAVKYDFKPGKDGAIIKRLLSTFGLPLLKTMAELYLADDDEFVIKNGYSLGLFSTKSNAYAMRVRGHGADKKLPRIEQQRLKEKLAADNTSSSGTDVGKTANAPIQEQG